MKTIKSIFGLLAITLISSISFSQNLGSIKGKLLDQDSMEIMGGYIWLETGVDKIFTGTDDFGNFTLSGIPNGTYEINMSYLSDTIRRTVSLKPDQVLMMGKLVIQKELGVVIVNGGGRDFIEPGEELKFTITAEELKHNAIGTNNIGKLVGSMSSDIKVAADGELYFRGARKGNMLYLIDGVKQTNFNAVPGIAIKTMTVYTGGLPAKYGDTTGGVVVMETKGYMDLYRNWRIMQRRAGIKVD